VTFTIYPAIDLRNGKVVRLAEGDPARMTAYSDDPAETARRWLDVGANWLHVVNLDGAFGESDDANRSALAAIIKVGACLQFGGGLRSLEGVARVLDIGVTRAVIGTAAIEKPDMLASALARFGAERIVVGIDARDGFVRVRGWKDNSGLAAIDLARQLRKIGLRTVVSTDVSRDGLGNGLNIDAAQELANAGQFDVIASGGVGSLDDVYAARDAHLSGVIIGRALYEGAIDLKSALKIQAPE